MTGGDALRERGPENLPNLASLHVASHEDSRATSPGVGVFADEGAGYGDAAEVARLGRTRPRVFPYAKLLPYQTEDREQREQDMDRAEMGDRIRQGLPLYGTSDQPEWVQGVAYRNSAFSQLKFRT